MMPGPQIAGGQGRAIIPKIVPMPPGAVLPGSAVPRSSTLPAIVPAVVNSAPLPPGTIPPGVHPDRFKTEMCNFFSSPVGCNKGGNCTYAHSENELRKLGPGATALQKQTQAAAPAASSAAPPAIIPAISQAAPTDLATALQIFAAVAAVDPGIVAPKPGICKWFQKGECYSGQFCKYSHELDLLGGVVAALAGGVAAAPQKQYHVCKWFLKGDCTSGANCRYLHPEGAGGSKKQSQPEPGDAKTDEDGDVPDTANKVQEEPIANEVKEEPPKVEE